MQLGVLGKAPESTGKNAESPEQPLGGMQGVWWALHSPAQGALLDACLATVSSLQRIFFFFLIAEQSLHCPCSLLVGLQHLWPRLLSTGIGQVPEEAGDAAARDGPRELFDFRGRRTGVQLGSSGTAPSSQLLTWSKLCQVWDSRAHLHLCT